MSRFYSDGFWHYEDEGGNWYRNIQWASLAATMYRYDKSLVDYRNMAVETVERGLLYNMRTPFYQAPIFTYPQQGVADALSTAPRWYNFFDGGPEGAPDPTGSDEAANIEGGAAIMWLAQMLWEADTTYFQPMVQRWTEQMMLCADWMSDINGNLIWYTNGNYLVQQCFFFAQIQRMCRQLGVWYAAKGDTTNQALWEANWSRYKAMYEHSYITMVAPASNPLPASAQWVGYGLVIGSAGPSGDGGDTVAWLTETPGHNVPIQAATFDGQYSQVQLDYLAMTYMVNRDYRINYLLNVIWNKLEPLMNFTNATVDCTGGSRQTGVRGWTTVYFQVIRLLGHRTPGRTNMTDAKVLAVWDAAGGIRNNLTTNIGISAPWNSLTNTWNGITAASMGTSMTTVGGTIRACQLAAQKIDL